MNLDDIMKLNQFEIEITSLRKGEVEINSFKNFFSLFNSIDAENRQKYKSKISFILVDLLRKSDESFAKESEDTINYIAEVITSIGVMFEEINADSESSDALIYFLHTLKSKNFSKISANLYNKLSDIITDISWIFKLTQNSESLFPVHELIVKVAEEFEYTNESLLHLTMALQIFKDVDEKFKDSESENKIKEISTKYNIGILECIINRGSLFENSDQNYRLNSTLIAKNEKYIIIRNKSKNYFDDFASDIIAEVNEHGEEMCYFVKIIIDESWKFISFEEFMFTASLTNKRIFLSQVIKNNTYNIFFSNSIIVDNDTYEFIQLTNVSKKDPRICLKEKNYENTFDEFHNIITRSLVKDVRASIIFGSSNTCDKVTLDFVLAIIKCLGLDLLNYDILSFEYPPEDGLTYQNRIIKKFFEYVMDKYDTDTVCVIYENYYRFLSDHFQFNLESTIKAVKHIIYPFIPYQPFASLQKVIQWVNHKYENLVDYNIEKIDIKNSKKGYQIFSESELDITNYTYQDDFFVQVEIGKSYSFVNHKEKDIQLDASVNKLFKTANKLLLDFDDYIPDNDVDRIDTRIIDMIKLIKGTRIDVENYHRFNVKKAECEDVICMFKLLWHFVINSIYNQKIDDFYKLVIDYHHTDSILMEEDWSKFFESISDMATEKGTLLIAKESSGDAGTLSLKYNQYHYENIASKRGELFKIFDVNIIQNEIEKTENEQYTYHGSIINKIIFITDNVTKGSATTQLLKYHLTGVKDNPKKKFLDLPKDKKVDLVIKNNNIPNENIEVYSLYCLETTSQITIDELNYKINSMKSIESKYILNDSISKLYTSIYDDRPNATEGTVCMIRCNNMPCKTVFSKQTNDTSKLVGIFNRKGEISSSFLTPTTP